MVARQEGHNILAHELRSDLNAQEAQNHAAFQWNHITPQGNQTNWAFRFNDREDHELWMKTFPKCLYESSRQAPWDKLKVCFSVNAHSGFSDQSQADEQEYVLKAHRDPEVEMDEDDDGRGACWPNVRNPDSSKNHVILSFDHSVTW